MKAKKAVKKAVNKAAKKAAKTMGKAIAKKLVRAAAKTVVTTVATAVATRVAKKALGTASTSAAKTTPATKKGRPPKAPGSKEPVLPHLRERWPRNEAERKAKATEYYKRLHATYPDAHCALDHEDAVPAVGRDDFERAVHR